VDGVVKYHDLVLAVLLEVRLRSTLSSKVF